MCVTSMSDIEDGSGRALAPDRSRLSPSPRHFADLRDDFSPRPNSVPESSACNGHTEGRTEAAHEPDVSYQRDVQSSKRRGSSQADVSSRDVQSSKRGGSSQAFYGGGSMANHSMYPYPYQPMPLPQYYGYPGMFPQPMSGMAGVGYAPMPQHSQPMTVHQTSASASAGFEPQASTSGYVVGQSSAFTGSEPQAGTTSGKVPRSSKVRSAKNLTLPHSYSSPPQRSRGRSFFALFT